MAIELPPSDRVQHRPVEIPGDLMRDASPSEVVAPGTVERQQRFERIAYHAGIVVPCPKTAPTTALGRVAAEIRAALLHDSRCYKGPDRTFY